MGWCFIFFHTVPLVCDNSDEGMILCGLLSALAGIGTLGVDRGWHHTPFLSYCVVIIDRLRCDG